MEKMFFVLQSAKVVQEAAWSAGFAHLASWKLCGLEINWQHMHNWRSIRKIWV